MLRRGPAGPRRAPGQPRRRPRGSATCGRPAVAVCYINAPCGRLAQLALDSAGIEVAARRRPPTRRPRSQRSLDGTADAGLVLRLRGQRRRDDVETIELPGPSDRVSFPGISLLDGGPRPGGGPGVHRLRARARPARRSSPSTASRQRRESAPAARGLTFRPQVRHTLRMTRSPTCARPAGARVSPLALALTACGSDDAGGRRRRPAAHRPGRGLAHRRLHRARRAASRPTRSAEVTFSFGSSTDLAAQAADGAPGDVLATADTTSMAIAEDAGVTGDVEDFATNVLVIVTAARQPAGHRVARRPRGHHLGALRRRGAVRPGRRRAPRRGGRHRRARQPRGRRPRHPRQGHLRRGRRRPRLRHRRGGRG